MPVPEKQFHLGTLSKEIEDEEWFTSKEDNLKNSYNTDFEKSSMSRDESEDLNELD